MTIALAAWRGLTTLADPLIARHLKRRAARGKEDPDRLGERFGKASLARPEGKLLWVHAASVGESLSALPLLGELRARHPGLQMLMTTGTVTSARLIAERAPWLLHQFPPVDTPGAVSGFLDHWRPDAALWIESEFWPNLLRAAAERGLPMALINGRLSATSARNWRFARRSLAELLDRFALRLVQTEEIAARLATLGVDEVTVTGDLKRSSPSEPPKPDDLTAARKSIGTRPLWLAASTHPGDEGAVLDTHATLASRAPELLTIVAPRHPERGAALAEAAAARGIAARRRSAGAMPGGQLYIADTLGEMALWYTLAPVALIGGGWDGIGGHNPLEAAQRGCAVLSGPDVPAFRESYAALIEAGAARTIAREVLAIELARLLGPDGYPTHAARAMAEAGLHAGLPDPQPLRRTLAALDPLLGEALA